MKTKKSKKRFGASAPSYSTKKGLTTLYSSELSKNAAAHAKKKTKNKFTKKALSPKKNDPVRGQSEDMKKALDKVRAKTVKDTRTGKHKTQSLAMGFYVTDASIQEYPHLKPVVALSDNVVIVLKDGSTLTVKLDNDRVSIRKTAGKTSVSVDDHSIFTRPWSTNVIEVM